jgi:hypothetical protein
MCKCPIPGCNFRYAVGNRGWYKHVGVLANHPTWQPEVTGESRIQAYRAAFPEWFDPLVIAPKDAPVLVVRSVTERPKRRTIPPSASLEEITRALIEHLVGEVRAKHPSGTMRRVS